jgi:hypothetical protein
MVLLMLTFPGFALTVNSVLMKDQDVFLRPLKEKLASLIEMVRPIVHSSNLETPLFMPS